MPLQKNPGSTFLVAVFLSVIILSLGLGAAQMVIKELNFSSDLLFGEQAYYAAESGVETALMNLENNPVQDIQNVEIVLGQASFLPEIDNVVLPGGSFSFGLTPLQSSRFRLLQDTDDSLAYSPAPAQNFNITVVPTGTVTVPDHEWQWKVLCQDGANDSYALQNNTTVGSVGNFLFNSLAAGPVAGGGIEEFDNWVTGMIPESCFFSVQNLSPDRLEFTFTANGGSLAPAIAKVQSTGKSGDRQKRIEFDYAQQNLGGLFDFVFFHWDEN